MGTRSDPSQKKGKSVQLLVKNAKVVNSDGVREADLAVEDGKFAAIAQPGALSLDADKVIDAGGKFVLPGVIDPHLHLQDAYYKYEQLVETETRAAAFGGVTTVIPMLFRRSDPNESYHTVFPYLIDAAKKSAAVDYAISGMLFDDVQIDELEDYARQYGMTSYKVMMAYKGAEAAVFGVSAVDDSQILRVMSKLAALGFPALTMVHTENMEIVYKYKDLVAAEGATGMAAYDEARPYFAEEENLRRAIYFSELTGCPLYVVHMSIGTGVELILDAQRRGVPVIAETCPHFLLFNTDDDNPQEWMGKVNPPIRNRAHQELLWEGIAGGAISTVGSDHSTLMPYEDKMKDDLWSAVPGYPGTGQILPVMLSEGVNKGRIDITDVARVCSENVARIFGIYPRKGRIAVGSDADLVIVDIDREHTLSRDEGYSIAGYSLYKGVTFRGWPVTTVLRGEVICHENEVVAEPGYGEYVPRVLNDDPDVEAQSWRGLYPPDRLSRRNPLALGALERLRTS
jgi:D-hydantoinase